MTAYRGIAMIMTNGKPISRLAESISSEGGSFFFKALGKGNLAFSGNTSIRFPIPALILILVFVFSTLSSTAPPSAAGFMPPAPMPSVPSWWASTPTR